MDIKSLIALTDFSAEAEHAVERAAAIARDHEAHLWLMYANRGDHELLGERIERLNQRAEQLMQDYGIVSIAASRIAESVENIIDAATKHDLCVMAAVGSQNSSTLHNFSTLTVLIEGSSCPVLAVKKAFSHPYAKAIAAIDFSFDPMEILSYACNFGCVSALEAFTCVERPFGTHEDAPYVSIEAGLPVLPRSSGRGHERVVVWVSGGRKGEKWSLFGRNRIDTLIAGRCQISGAELVLLCSAKPKFFSNFMQRRTHYKLLSQVQADLLFIPYGYLSPRLAKR